MVGTRRFFFAAILLAVFAGPGLAVDPAMTGEITESEIRDHVRFLAADELEGRCAGEEGARRAAAYIAGEFERLGLTPGGDEGGWLQKFGLPGGLPVPGWCRLGITGANPMSLELDRDWQAFSFAQGAEIEGARLAFAGFGIRAPDMGYDDYADLDVKGKVVMVLHHGPRERAADYRFRGAEAEHVALRRKAEVAERAGAVALIVVNDVTRHPGRPDRRPPTPSSVRRSAQIPVIYLKRESAETVFTSVGQDLTALEATIDATGKPCSRTLTRLRVNLTVALDSARTANVIGLLPGSDPDLADEVVVVGAHYDHVGLGRFGSLADDPGDQIHNGADDNASGTAGVIEIAEYFTRPNRRPRRTMVFIAFSAEELGMLGSNHYVERPRLPLQQTVAMVNFDMIGRGGDGRLFLGGTGTSPVLPGLIETAVEGRALTLWQSPDGRAPSDNKPFFARGVPTVFFHTGGHDDYHRPTDDWDKLDYGTMKRILDAATVVIDGLANLDEVPRAAVLGVRLAVGAGPPGQLVRSVEAGSPAEVAGIRAGDRIIAIGGHPITDRREYKRVIGTYCAGQQVEVRIFRHGAEHTLAVCFSAKPR